MPHTRPPQASRALRPAGLLNRPRRPLSRGFDQAGCPARPLVSYQINRQLSGWNLPPLVTRAVGAHREIRDQCEIAPWRPSLLVVSRPCSSATSGSQHAARAAALHAPNPPTAAKSAHENAISGPCMRFWRGSSPWPSTERSAGAAAVINDEGFAEAFGQLGCQRARKGVRPAAGRERHDHRHRLLGPGLCDGLLVQLCWAGLGCGGALTGIGRTYRFGACPSIRLHWLSGRCACDVEPAPVWTVLRSSPCCQSRNCLNRASRSLLVSVRGPLAPARESRKASN